MIDKFLFEVDRFFFEVWPKIEKLIEKLISILMMLVCGCLAIAYVIAGRYAWTTCMAICFIWWAFVTCKHFIKPRLGK